MAGTIPQNGSGRLSADSGHSYLEHEQPSPSEEDSLDAAFHTNNNTTDIGQSNGGDHSALRLAAINPDTSNLQPFSADGTPLKLPMYEGLSAVRHGGDTGSTLALKAARTMSSPLKPAVTVGNNGLTSRAAKRPRKKTLSPEDGGTAGTLGCIFSDSFNRAAWHKYEKGEVCVMNRSSNDWLIDWLIFLVWYW